jgi:hypothetical protein
MKVVAGPLPPPRGLRGGRDRPGPDGPRRWRRRPRIWVAPDLIRWLARLGARLRCACGEGGHCKEAMVSGGDSWRPAVLSASATGVPAVPAVAGCGWSWLAGGAG